MLIKVTLLSHQIVCLVDRIQKVYHNHSYMYASPVLDISGRSWLRLWVSSTDRDAIINSLDPTTDKLFLPHKKFSIIFAGRTKGARMPKKTGAY